MKGNVEPNEVVDHVQEVWLYNDAWDTAEFMTEAILGSASYCIEMLPLHLPRVPLLHDDYSTRLSFLARVDRLPDTPSESYSRYDIELVGNTFYGVEHGDFKQYKAPVKLGDKYYDVAVHFVQNARSEDAACCIARVLQILHERGELPSKSTINEICNGVFEELP